MEKVPFDAPLSPKARALLLALIDTDLEVNTLCVAACYAAKILEIVKTAKQPIALFDGELGPRLADPILALQRVTHEFSQVLESAHRQDAGLGGLRVEIPLT
jgi:hypothetical protein